jgi:hypothetical protein
MKVAAAGSTFMGRFPAIEENIDCWKTADDKLDIAKIRSDLKNCDFLQFSNDDNSRTIAFTIEFLRQLGFAVSHAAADPTCDARTEVEKPIDHSLERRMEKEKFGYCRFDIDEHAGAIRVRIGVSNPKDVVGNVIDCCRTFAVDCARLLLYLQEQLPIKVELIGRGDLDDVFEEAKWRDEKFAARKAVAKANEKRSTCVRRIGVYCSPSDPQCPCYNAGKCVALELDKKWESFK